jgi:CRP-like cAMP-binding protein
MPIYPMPHVASENRLLATLPRAEYERLRQHGEVVKLTKGDTLYHAGDRISYAYFPHTGMLSLLSASEKGNVIEAAMVGNEGVVGIPIILRVEVVPYHVTTQVSGEAFILKADIFRREFERGEALRDRILRYTHALLSHITQSVICSRFHSIDERLCRWLLITCDRVNSEHLELTQEIISQMLGTPRTAVTVAALALQDAGIIRYRRGKITILNRKRLEASSCECYGAIKKEIDALVA